MSKTKSWFFEKTKKFTIFSFTPQDKERTLKLKSGIKENINSVHTDILKIGIEYNEQLDANKLHNFDEMEKYPGKHNLPKLTYRKNKKLE